MKKLLCLVLCVLLCPVMALAEETASLLTWAELNTWAEGYLTRALAEEPLNTPAESFTADGYEYIYNFATLYADTPVLSADSVVRAVVVTASEERGLRGVNVGASMAAVLGAFYNENPDLLGSETAAVLYAVDRLPEAAQWAQVYRDGQRVQTIQYALHEQLASGGEGYTDAGVIFTMAENRVSAVRVYGLDSRIAQEEVNDVLYNAQLNALTADYAQVPTSNKGAELTAFREEDLLFSGLDFLTLDAEAAVAALGEPLADTWLENDNAGYIRVMTFPACEVTFLYDAQKENCRVDMLLITADGLEGPRAVRCGDTFSSVYSRFRSGEGEYQADGTELLYGVLGEGDFGYATYGNDASAVVRYSFVAADGRRVTLHLTFTIMELTEIMLYAE